MSRFTDRRERLLRRHIEDELEPAERLEFERLCREDPGLEREARELREQMRLLGGAPGVETPGDLGARVMDGVLRARPPSRVYAFLFRPRTVRVRVMTGALAAAAVLAIVVLAVRLAGHRGESPAGEDRAGVQAAVQADEAAVDEEGEEPAGLRFELEADRASRVTLVGDFNGWDERGLDLTDEDGDGVWTLVIDAPPGRYKYRLLVDGESWVADPAADAQVDDGFGGVDSVRYVL